ncbi:MAG: iron ABC transporter permease [Armatimonadota bacterium]|nr:iron ABC transporter permease [Armatimonadota bacterium]
MTPGSRAAGTGSAAVTRVRRRTWHGLLPAAGLSVAGALSLPVLTVAASVFFPSEAAWAEFVRLVLPRYVRNTVWLLLGVAVGTLGVGVGAAWLVTAYRFPGRRLCQALLLLPLAVPAYLVAYTYADLLQYSGPIQSALRGWLGWTRGYPFPEIRSLGGAVFVLSFVLYPYVYLLTRAALLEQSPVVWEVSRTLGHGPWSTFFRVALPVARPGIAAGLSLVAMEVLADFGTVKYFELDTFATGIYLVWFSFGSVLGAAKLAVWLMGFVLAVVAAERLSRGRKRYHRPAGPVREARPQQLTGPRAALALVACLVPPALGFGIPGGYLGWMAWVGGDPLWGRAFLRLAGNTFVLAATAAGAAVLLSALLAYGLRLAPTPVMRLAARVVSLGYAVPGVVVAVGVLVPLGWLDNTVDAYFRRWWGVPTGLVLTGTTFTLVYAYLVRFLAAALSTVEAGLSRIGPTLEGAARTLGHGPGSVLLRVHAPLMRGSIFTAALLVFVDALKELPATLVLRPLNFDTLAVRLYLLASDERLVQASTSGLCILAVGLVPVLWLDRAVHRSRAEAPAGLASADPSGPDRIDRGSGIRLA